jgi:hypothetical protein
MLRFFAAFLLTIIFSCETTTAPSGNAAADIYDFIKSQGNRSDNVFWVVDITKELGDKNYFYQMEFTKRYENEAVIIYVETQRNHTIDTLTLDNLGTEFRDVIKPSVENVYGTASDLDNNNKTLILLHDIKDGYDGTGGFIGGYFYNVDMYRQSVLNSSGYPENTARSNEGEILYIDMVQQNPTDEDVYWTIAHEYQHLVGFNQRHLISRRSALNDTWINEGLAEHIEYLTYGQKALDNRMYYLSSNFDPNTSLISWNDDDRLSSYALSAMYFNYLAHRIGNTDFLSTLNKIADGDHIGVGKILEDVFATGDHYENFSKSYHEFAIDGLYKVKTGTFPSIIKGAENLRPGQFTGISSYPQLTTTAIPFVPRFYKFSIGSSVSTSGNQYVIDLSQTDVSINETTSITSIGKFENQNYGVAFITSPTSSSSNYTVSTNGTFISNKQKKKRIPRTGRIHFEPKPLQIKH